jgi:tRNA-2-methylthio-N6-dimethylallyladenosine synthase
MAGILIVSTTLRCRLADISRLADFIVGFPGETAEDFEKTMALIEVIGFYSFSFLFSPPPVRRVA